MLSIPSDSLVAPLSVVPIKSRSNLSALIISAIVAQSAVIGISLSFDLMWEIISSRDCFGLFLFVASVAIH